MVLIDAGGEFHMYASDITRTFPVNGRFTDPQRDLYQAVLNVQKECVKRCVLNEGVTMNELHRISESISPASELGTFPRRADTQAARCCTKSYAKSASRSRRVTSSASSTRTS
jgi:hypothetical protein